MKPITMNFLHVIEQNDLQLVTLKKFETGSSVITEIVVYYSKNHHYNQVQFLNN